MPPSPPPPPSPPGSPGSLHWGRAFIGVALLAAIFYGVPKVPGCAPAAPVDAPTLDVKDAGALMGGVRTAYTVAIDSWTQSSARLLDVETLKSMVDPSTLQSAGLFSQTTFRIFLTGLFKPLLVPSWSAAVLGDLVLGFTLLNAVGFWAELLGYLGGYMYGVVSAFGLLDGYSLGVTASLVFIGVEVLVALLVAYLLFWMVLAPGLEGVDSTTTIGDYQLLAIGAYLAFGLVHVLYALGCLLGSLEPLRLVVYTVKAASALGCAFYALQMRADKTLPESQKLPAPAPAKSMELV